MQVSPLFLESLPGAVDAVPGVAGVPAIADVPGDSGVLNIIVDKIKLIRLYRKN